MNKNVRWSILFSSCLCSYCWRSIFGFFWFVSSSKVLVNLRNVDEWNQCFLEFSLRWKIKFAAIVWDESKRTPTNFIQFEWNFWSNTNYFQIVSLDLIDQENSLLLINVIEYDQDFPFLQHFPLQIESTRDKRRHFNNGCYRFRSSCVLQ